MRQWPSLSNLMWRTGLTVMLMYIGISTTGGGAITAQDFGAAAAIMVFGAGIPHLVAAGATFANLIMRMNESGGDSA
jgi:hypothetical protein